jgi:flagellar hook-length control protein FliK
VVPRLPGADTTPVTVPSAPTVQLAPTTPAVAAATPQAPAVPVPAGYTANLAKPLFSLATAGPAEHTMTVSVNPEKLGPVTVQAHVSGGNVRIELFAATADGREVLRQTLPELRRDLAGAGINASLDLSSNSQSGSPHGGQDRETFTRRAPASNHPGSNGRPLHMNDQIARTRPAAYGPDTVLDVLA